MKAARKEKVCRLCNRYALPLQFLACCALYFLIEVMSRHSFLLAAQFASKRTKVFFYNAYLIFTTTLFVFLLRRRTFWRMFVFIAWAIFGAANGILLANRVTPLTGPDLGMMAEANGVIGKYFSRAQRMLALIGIIVLIVWLVKKFFTADKYQGKRNLKAAVPGVILGWVGLFVFTKWGLATGQLSSYFSNIANAYLDYGFPYSLSVTVFDTGINQPNNYSQKQVDAIIKAEGNLDESVESDNMPNVIIVQLESFFDPGRVRWLSFNKDPLPNWHALCKKYSSGLYTVPTVGAGTVNTEFETLTGMSLRYFGAGEYPYKGILRETTCESAATALSALGYTTHAIHDNTATFYGRKTVYSYLGFSSFTSEEYMDTQNDVNENGWMRDENLIGPITDALDSTGNRDFVFTVSVQPHGAYPTEYTIADPEITVAGTKDDGSNAAWEYYCNQIYEEDQFVADLIETLNKRDEPTVVLFYGDHLPTMGLSNTDMKDGSTIFQTNYLIWDNFGMEKKSKNIIAYRAFAELTKRLNIHEGTMFRFQQTMTKNENYLLDMQVLQYDMLYGRHYVYGGANPYSKSVLAMGVKPVTITGIQKVSSDGVYYVEGQNFTQSCRMAVNDEQVDTTFIDSTRLLIKGVQLKEGDWVNVQIRANSSSHAVLSTSNTLVYGYGRLAASSAVSENAVPSITGENEQ
ncbi:MAG: sulfatase-like hydrolase/transferase [Lachnospiraceae bacterium]|nr:sulfatase-like hydrolase/transferase [Lachnospiraceae bacterium]